MLTVDQREEIRRAYFIEGRSIRQIAREGRHDRRTVRKSLHDAGPPKYTQRVPRRRPVLDPFLAIIDQWLSEDESRPPKQRAARAEGLGLWGLAPATPAEVECDPAYPDVCIPSPPPDRDCGEIAYTNFTILAPDPHRFDGDKDGVGCER